jgi:hypothetical protein
MMKYSALMNEVECINSAWGFVGALDALTYIRENQDEYEGTQVYREFRAFMREGAMLFATAEEA